MFCFVVVALAGGATYHAFAGDVDEMRYKPLGRRVDVGGRRMHIDCTGQGSLAVILEAELGWVLLESSHEDHHERRSLSNSRHSPHFRPGC